MSLPPASPPPELPCEGVKPPSVQLGLLTSPSRFRITGLSPERSSGHDPDGGGRNSMNGAKCHVCYTLSGVMWFVPEQRVDRRRPTETCVSHQATIKRSHALAAVQQLQYGSKGLDAGHRPRFKPHLDVAEAGLRVRPEPFG